MSKSIEALRNESGNIFWPATASDAVIHPKTKKTLTEHITRYNLTDFSGVTSLETGIQKLTGSGENEFNIIPNVGDRIIIGKRGVAGNNNITRVLEYVLKSNTVIAGEGAFYNSVSNWELCPSASSIVQADWATSDPTDPSYIQNKPTIEIIDLT